MNLSRNGPKEKAPKEGKSVIPKPALEKSKPIPSQSLVNLNKRQNKRSNSLDLPKPSDQLQAKELARQKQKRLELKSKHPILHGYIHDIIKYLREKDEQRHALVNGLIEDNPNIRCTEFFEKRLTAVTYFFEMGVRHKYKRESLYLAVNIYDRFTLIRSRDGLLEGMEQVMVACLWTASKMIEYYPPSLHRIKLTSSISEIVKMENLILTTLDFDMNPTTSLNHLDFYLNLLEFTQEESEFAHYILDFSLFNLIVLAKYKPEQIALGAIKILWEKNKKDVGDLCFDLPVTNAEIESIASRLSKNFVSLESRYSGLVISFSPAIVWNKIVNRGR